MTVPFIPCSECVFHRNGECCLHPPTAYLHLSERISSPRQFSLRPAVTPADGCGQGRRKSKPKPKSKPGG